MRFLSTLGLAYLIVLAFLFFAQRTLIYLPPPPGPRTPADFKVPYSEVMLENGSGPKLHGWWIRQPNDNAATPSALYCHGNGATLSSLAHVTAIFYELGWNVLLFDYRNYGKSEKSTTGFSEQLLVNDALAAYQWLLSNSGSASDRIIVWGHSLGAAVALQVAIAREPAALVLEGPFTSISEMTRYRYPWLYVPSFLVLDKYDSLSKIRKLKSRLLVMHAEKDTVIPLSMGRELFAAAPYPKEFLLIKDRNHNDFPEVYREYAEELRRFAQSAVPKALAVSGYQK